VQTGASQRRSQAGHFLGGLQWNSLSTRAMPAMASVKGQSTIDESAEANCSFSYRGQR